MTITVTIQDVETDHLHTPLHKASDPHCPCRLALPPSGGEAALAVLTNREREVLGLLGAGLPNRALARQLGIAERTVKAHIAHIIGKLGLRTRIEAAVIAVVHHDVICPERNLKQPPGRGETEA